ncbi:MAG: hypothetical protein V1787_00280 [Candidatus Micrarchaeota archaeon]
MEVLRRHNLAVHSKEIDGRMVFSLEHREKRTVPPAVAKAFHAAWRNTEK